MSKVIKIEMTVDLEDKKQVESLMTILKEFSEAEISTAKKTAPEKTAKKTAPEKTAKKTTPEKTTKKTTPEKASSTKKTSEVTIDMVRSALAEKVSSHRSEIKSKLTELGANNVTSLDPENYSEFMNFLHNL